MSILKDAMREELERNLAIQQAYSSKLKKLKKGSIVVKKIKHNSYYYLVYRNEDKKVTTEYLGSVNNTSIEQIREEIEQAKKYKDSLKKLKRDENKIRKAIKVL